MSQNPTPQLKNNTRKKICFDGALPLVKRPTRLERLESSRSKLEHLRLSSPGGFSRSGARRDAVKIDDARMVFGRCRSIAVDRGEAPADPFMVATVIEDLKHRWSWSRIAEYASDAGSFSGHPPDGYPWVDMTHVEPGEADIYAAVAARLTNSSVLTGDSDFLLHDLGPDGSVIFLDSLETMQFQGPDFPESSLFVVRAAELRPDEISKKFGITDLRRLGFELKYSPSTNISTLVQRCKDHPSDEEPSDLYLSFLKEYEASGRRQATRVEGVVLDPRIAELCLQYEASELRSDLKAPHIYLPFLVENCARRCAWIEGSWIRALAYSFFDAAFPDINASQSVMEYIRRGNRVCPTPVKLLKQKEDIETHVEDLLQNLSSTLPPASKALIYWKTFALSEIWRPSDTNNNNPLLDRGDIRQFLEEGCTGARLDWNDIHLGAQVQAVLYSLKILKDLATAVLQTLKGGAKALCGRIVDVLSTLPPLHILSLSRCSLKSETRPDGSVDSAVCMLSDFLRKHWQGDASVDEQALQGMSCLDDSVEQGTITTDSEEFRVVRSRRNKSRKIAEPAESTKRQGPKKSANLYEMLGNAG